MENLTKCLWPQENRRLMRERAKKAHPSNYSTLRKINYLFKDFKLIVKCLGTFYGRRNFRPIEREIMYLFNGSGTEDLADKYTFLKVCLKLGYRTPKQILVKNNYSTTEKIKLFEQSFKSDGYGFFLKPEAGCVGRGIKIVKTKKDALSLLNELSGDYVIEETINIDKEFRYILYVDPDENKWHMAFEKVRPDVVGDGKSAIWLLVLKDSSIPFDRKITLLKKNYKILGEIMPSEVKIRLTNIGIQEAGSYGKLPTKTEMAALDVFALRFISDLEKYIGHRLPILCFDLGVTAPLKENMTFEELREIVTPFECQMPFSPYAHFKFMHHGFGPFFDFYRMLVSDMVSVVNGRLEREKTTIK